MADSLTEEAGDTSMQLTDAEPSTKLIKCPMYCPNTCLEHHHPLLVAILNCIDTPEIELMEKKLLMLSNLINKYKESKQWAGNDPIPDVVEKYRAPMLHWVATFGRVGAAIWLIGHNISDPTTRSSIYNGETALHRALLCLQETCPIEPGHMFVQLLSVLEPALSVVDNNGNTPLHVCCYRLKAGREKVDYYKKCLHYMLYELNNEKKLSGHDTMAVLNMKNNDGDTGLHFLAASDKHLIEVRSLVQFGADFSIKNDSHLTPYDVAKEHHCSSVSSFFETSAENKNQQNCDSMLKTTKTSNNLSEQCHKKREKKDLGVIDHHPSSESSSESSASPSTHREDDCIVGQIKMSTCLSDDDDKQTGDADSDETMGRKRIKLDDTSAAGNSQNRLQSATLTSESRKQSDIQPANQVLSLPMLFSSDTDEDAQKYFEQAVAKHISSLKSKKQAKRAKMTLSELVQLPSRLGPTGQVDREIVKKMLMEADPAVLSQYLVYMKEARLCCEPVIEFMLNTHNDALTNLKLANKCEDGIQQLLKDNQKTQESLVLDIMKKYDNLSKLSKEEQILNNEMENIRDNGTAARSTNSSHRERLNNCEAAIDVLKHLYAESINKKSDS